MPSPCPPGGTDLSFDQEIDRFDRFAGDLVRLEPFSRDALHETVVRFAALVEHHLELAAQVSDGRRGTDGGALARRGVLHREHERFRASVAELRGLLAVVEAEDHGGHRQALGQYGRILAEALRAHCRDEGAAGATDVPLLASGKHN